MTTEKMSAVEIFKLAMKAGFTSDQAVTMTAVALAESAGDPLALATKGEESHGLWQINRAFHKKFTVEQLRNPLENARAAFEVSEGGADLSRWSVTHAVNGKPYQKFQGEAQAAARSLGFDKATGYFDGVEDYKDHRPVGSSEVEQSSGIVVPAALGPTKGDLFIKAARDNVGGPNGYKLGATPALTDKDPDLFDCSSYVQWAARQAGVTLPRLAEEQFLHLSGKGQTMSVQDALNTRGALLFRFGHTPVPGERFYDKAHVVISLGDGRVAQAANETLGVIEGQADPASFTHAAYEPSLLAPMDASLTAASGPVVGGIAEPAVVDPAEAQRVAALGHVGGFWTGEPADPAKPAPMAFKLEVISPPGAPVSPSFLDLPVLPPLGLQPLLSASGLPVSPPAGVDPAITARTSAGELPALPAKPVAGPTALPPLPGAAGDRTLQNLFDANHSPGDHPPDPLWATGAPLPGEVTLQPVESGQVLPGEVTLQPVSSGQVLPNELTLQPVESGRVLPGESTLHPVGEHPMPPLPDQAQFNDSPHVDADDHSWDVHDTGHHDL